MTSLEFTPAQEELLRRLQPLDTLEALQAVVSRVEPEVAIWVTEILEPAQPADELRIELAALFVLASEHEEPLARFRHGPQDLARFADVIVAWRTLDALFGTGLHLGDYRTRTVAEAVAASLPVREKARRAAAVVFFRDAARHALYQDHNASGTLDEEVADLRQLVAAAKRDLATLAEAGFGPDDLATAERLLAEAEGRDILAVLGLQTQADLRARRNAYVTLAVTLARYLRACAEAAFFDDPKTAERFRRTNFATVLRRLRPIRRSKDDAEAPADAPETPATAPLTPAAPAEA